MHVTDNRISLQKLEVFCKVVELGGVQRAAEDLFISQPVVSAHLRSLQERIGAQLFERDGRGIALTEAGREVHVWAADVLRGRLQLAASLENLSSGVAGTVTIATSMSVGTYLLSPLLIDFRRRHRRAQLTLTISGVEAALTAVVTSQVDFCVLATDAMLDSESFEAELLAEPRFSLVTGSASQLVGESVQPDALNGMPFVCAPRGVAIRGSQDAALASIGVTDRRVQIEMGNADTIKQAVAADLGLALLWRSSVDRELSEGTLREVKIEGHTLRDKLYLVRRRNHRSTALQDRLLAEIRSGVTAQLAAFEEPLGNPPV
ncbi:LysR family transcriptional regulator [Rhodococcus sp. ACPA4]|uniref:LysR family transcriptional regulator n=1 Tax=Rhodococcus TaxID=1827 RepID=UPI000BB11CD0|nr:LysR family transcriptional regulator [Rhodococcus sp. ACPA4]PBC36066.1 LysR family transcriptional regulator [Rhodococcus sp. ACPA4]